MTHKELDDLWDISVNISIAAGDSLARYRFAESVAAAEREAICKIVYGLCVSDNNAQEIVEVPYLTTERFYELH